MDFREDVSIEINVVFLYKTDEAIKVEDADGIQKWLPLTGIRDDGIDGDYDSISEGSEMTLEIGENLARDKGLL